MTIPGTKISAYPDGGAPQTGEKFVIARGGANYSVLGSDLGGGWQSVSEVWTRTGSHTFTVPGDLTTRYQKGVFVRYKDGGGFEYGVVHTSSYSAPSTTVTLITNSDYEMAAATITDTAISRIRNPDGWPVKFAYALTWTAVTADPVIGNGTLEGYWIPTGPSVIFVKLRVIAGGTTTYGTGIWNFSIPVTPALLGGTGTTAIESGAGNMLIATTRYSLSAFVRTADMRGIYTNGILQQGTPGTMASGSNINLSCEYEY